MTALELRQEMNQYAVQARAIRDKADTEKRDMTTEESASFDKHMAGYDAKKAELEKLIADERASKDRTEKLNAAEKELKTSAGRRTDPTEPTENEDEKGVVKFKNRKAYPNAENRRTSRKVEIAKKFMPICTKESRTLFANWLRDGRDNELRALQMDLDISGGFLVTPQQFAAKLIAIVDDLVWIRQLGTVITLTNATTLGVPSRDVDIADSDWTSELATGNEDTALQFGKRELQPHPLAKRIKISNKLLRAGALDVEGIVRDRLGYKFGITQEKAFLNGDGVQKPLGIFTVAPGNGISTARDIVTGLTTAYTADGLINAKYFLKPQYWANARWVFHRFGLQRIRQLKDTNGQYLWNPSGIGQANLAWDAKGGSLSLASDAILGLPFVLSEYCPSTFTTGQYVGALGDFSFYWIVEALSMQMQRLVELYAQTNQTGYIARAEIDGAPVLEEPFVRIITS